MKKTVDDKVKAVLNVKQYAPCSEDKWHEVGPLLKVTIVDCRRQPVTMLIVIMITYRGYLSQDLPAGPPLSAAMRPLFHKHATRLTPAEVGDGDRAMQQAIADAKAVSDAQKR